MKKNNLAKEDGFTLVEMMIALAISMILVVAFYSAHRLQQRSFTAQDQVAQMQQNIRAGLGIMVKEIRMAGFDPDRKARDASCNAGGTGSPVAPGIHTATATQFGFSMDLNEDGDCLGPGENVTYNLYVATSGIQSLGRQAPENNQAVAEEIEDLEFYYTLSDGTQTLSPTTAQLPKIRSVQISILARAGQRDPGFTNTRVYNPASSADLGTAWGPYNDNLRRRLLITTVFCRNMGGG